MITFNQILGVTKSRHHKPPPDTRYDPVEGDHIDELVNWSLQQGKEQRR